MPCTATPGKAVITWSGPLSRLNLNHAQLLPAAQKALQDAGIKLPITNPYKSLIARAVELVHFYAEAIELIQAYAPNRPGAPRTPTESR